MCGYSANRFKSSLYLHIETHFDGLEYPCLQCNKVFATKNSWNAHKSANHRDVMIIDDNLMDGNETRKCTRSSLGSGVNADAKIETKSEPVEAVEPMIEDSNNTFEEDNVTESESRAKETEELMNSTNPSIVEEPDVESVVSETTDISEDNSSRDEDCGKYVTNYDDFFLEDKGAEANDFRRHIVAKIKVSSIEQAEQRAKELKEKVEPGMYRCTYCGFRSRSNIRTHILSHFEGLEFNCDMCNKTFNTKHLLSCHKSNKHRE